ncbi:protein PIGMENT DEFECTIVE 338, chloroplastic-like [Zingiber officinale]|uniref:protein PIGMENT DEFECTIVE 338, chloroplastic-like n=1 Tax=Zingiber officinale TaxID=94328 RepID=UPI001C4A8DE0|nr:protein PIGMENT DEFECTIVE 338, chloroplastic-like [Zingiber officinale]
MVAVLTLTPATGTRSHRFHPLLLFNSKLPPPFLFPKNASFSGGRLVSASFCGTLAAAAAASSSSPDPRSSKETDVELLLHDKPYPIPVPEEEEPAPAPPDPEEALAPFLKFFKSRDPSEEYNTISVEERDGKTVKEEEKETVSVQYYDPKPGDLVVGVVVSGNDKRLDVNVGADMLGTMLTKEVLPLYEAELPYLLCDRHEDVSEFTVPGKMGVLSDEEAFSGGKAPGKAIVEVGTILFAEVLGRTLSGRPLLSTRRMFRRVAWHRVRQIKQLNEPIEIKIFEWNTGGLLTRIEGLRAFLPKAELMTKIKNFTDLKENVGRKMYVCITRINEATNDLIISEREAWDMMNLKEGTLLEGTVRKILPYGAQIRLGDTNRSGLLHISNITRARVASISDILKVDEKVKVLVVKSMFPDKISLSIADLESESGLLLSDKEKVFFEAEKMAKKYRRKLPVISAKHNKLDSLQTDLLPFDDEARLYANWRWFIFQQHAEVNEDNTIVSECSS